MNLSDHASLLQAPIQLFGVEGRYAHALYSAATKQKSLQSVEKELNSFKDILKVDTKFNQFVKDPTIKRGTKSEVLLASLQKQKFSPITTNFLCTYSTCSERFHMSLLQVPWQRTDVSAK